MMVSQAKGGSPPEQNSLGDTFESTAGALKRLKRASIRMATSNDLSASVNRRREQGRTGGPVSSTGRLMGSTVGFVHPGESIGCEGLASEAGGESAQWWCNGVAETASVVAFLPAERSTPHTMRWIASEPVAVLLCVVGIVR